MATEEHISVEPVRSYLLGYLDETSAASIEERYFTDRRYFLAVQAVEERLIQDYFANRLANPDRISFENSYLSSPGLRSRVDEVRAKQQPVPARGLPARLRMFGAMAAMVLICVGLAIWLSARADKTPLIPLNAASRPILASLSISSGVIKGDGASQAYLNLPAGTGDVHFILDLPGQRQPVLCFGRLSLVSSDGSWQTIWSSSPVWSILSGDSQKAIFAVDSSLLKRSDYVFRVTSSDGQVYGTHSFRVLTN